MPPQQQPESRVLGFRPRPRGTSASGAGRRLIHAVGVLFSSQMLLPWLAANGRSAHTKTPFTFTWSSVLEDGNYVGEVRSGTTLWPQPALVPRADAT